MSEQHAIGINTFKMGDVGATGGMGGTLSALPGTVRGSAKLTTSEPSVTNFFQDNKPRPVESLVGGDVVEKLEAEFYDVTPDVWASIFGGTASAGPPATYDAHDSIQQIEQSIELTTKNGVKLEIVRALITASIDWGFNDTGIGKVKFMATIMEPTDGTSKAYTVTMPSS